MALKTFVKINSVNNLSDARYCAGMNVNLMGFCIDSSSEDYISPEKYNEITSWTSGVEFVGELGSASEISDGYSIGYVESDDLDKLNAINLEAKKILNVDIRDIGTKSYNGIDLVVVTKSTDDITEEEILEIKKLAENNKVLIGYGVDVNNLDKLLVETNAYGIAISGGSEIRPGYKDYDELADILEALEIDEWA